MFNVGWISSSAAIWRQGENPEKRIRFPVPAYVVETERERILIDTGLNPLAVNDPQAYYMRREAGLFGLELGATIAEQIDVDTLTHVVLTHLHFDHAGALALVSESVPVFLQRREWEGAHDEATIKRNFLYPRDYAVLEDRDLRLVEGDHDLLDDGSVRLLSTPGHTPGHQSMPSKVEPQSRQRVHELVGASLAASSISIRGSPCAADVLLDRIVIVG